MYAAPPTPPPAAEVRKHGWWYGGTLVELVLANLADLVSGLASLSTHGAAVSHDVDELLETAPPDHKLTTVLVLLSVANLVCVYGLWTWKKWGFTGYVVLYLVTIVVAHKVDPTDHSVPGIFGLAVLVWMVVNRWRFFE
ncbi:MAG: hypothetical protein ABIP39_08015 [Polyangiaceae bacterium]